MISEEKIHDNFAGLVVRKDLSKLVKGNALVPTYVLEYLLGQYCATNDEESIKSGIESVKRILQKHYVNRTQAELVRSKIKEEGRFKIIDRVEVALNDKEDIYEAAFSNLGLKKVPIDSDYIKEHPKLLVGGVWCILDMEYSHSDESKRIPWSIESLKPIQISHIEFDSYTESRKSFSTQEWIDFLIQCLGFNPDELGDRNKWFQLVRLICYCENNYNLIELGPKGTGKSHVFSEFSPHGILVSGSEVTLAKLFVNNSTGRPGLVGYWDVVAFDEFAGTGKRVDKTLVDVMKNYMANRSFSRGTEQLTADASMAFVGNTSKSVSYMLKHSNLFTDLPDKYLDSAFLDRIHFYIPGWEVSIIRNEMFTDQFGFIVDYLAQVLKSQRFHDYSDLYRKYFELDNSLSTRDREGINKTFSGLMKIIYPHREVSKSEVEQVLQFAMEGRKRIKTEIYKIDHTFDPVAFKYTDLETHEEHYVLTNEEKQYPRFFQKRELEEAQASTFNPGQPGAPSTPHVSQNPHFSASRQQGTPSPDAPQDQDPREPSPQEPGLQAAASKGAGPEKPGPIHYTVAENQTGISYHKLFSDYLNGAKRIDVIDPYIRRTWQIRNFIEFIQVVLAVKEEGEEVHVHLITDNGDMRKTELERQLQNIQDNLLNVDIDLTFEIASKKQHHARSITTDTGWKISLDRGLDIFQRFDSGLFSIESASQEARFTKAFEITYIPLGKEESEG